MAKSKSTFEKMQREKAKRQKRQEKLKDKERKKEEKADEEVEELVDGEDPDLAGIVAGPQPVNLDDW